MRVEGKRKILKKNLTTHVVRNTKRVERAKQLTLEGKKFCWDVLDYQ